MSHFWGDRKKTEKSAPCGIQTHATFFVLFSFLIPIQRTYFHVPQMALLGFFPTTLCRGQDSNSQLSLELHQPKTFWRTLYRLSYLAAAKPMPSWLLGVNTSTADKIFDQLLRQESKWDLLVPNCSSPSSLCCSAAGSHLFAFRWFCKNCRKTENWVFAETCSENYFPLSLGQRWWLRAWQLPRYLCPSIIKLLY